MSRLVLRLLALALAVLPLAVSPTWTAGDQDGDGVADAADDCPARINPAQVDTDGDGIGNACDDCPYAADADQTDSDGDGVGDACDACPDTDADVPQPDEGARIAVDAAGCNVTQLCPCARPVGATVPWRRHGLYVGCVRRRAGSLRRARRIDYSERVAFVNLARAAACGGANVTPGDSDGDGILDDGDETGVAGDRPCADGKTTACDDNCPRVWNPGQADLDGDGRGNRCDADVDGDGVPTADDDCPEVVNKDQADADEDGVGDACDLCPDTTADADVDARGCADDQTPAS